MSAQSHPDCVRRISLHDSVSAVIASSPAAMSVFMHHRMACPGCAMAPYMTIAEAAASYRLDPQRLLAELQAAAQEGTLAEHIRSV